MKSYALHGFLGLPSDWNNLTVEALTTVDLYAYGPPSEEGLQSWARSFNNSVEGGLLIGYSLGGRLAMHALLENPSIWRGAILFSTHPGIAGTLERAMRRESDILWARSFLSLSWEQLMDKWESQSVFAGTLAPPRHESDYDRRHLALTLMHWSLGVQQPLFSSLESLEIPILWVTGERDRKFALLSRKISLVHPLSRIIDVPGCGHRLLWDNPTHCQSLINTFIDSL